MKSTAIYARVSTKIQANEGSSLDYQIEAGFKKANELNISEDDVEIYREEGFSGEDIDRPEMNRLRKDIAQGIIKRVIILHPDRFSREMTDKLIVCSEFERKGIELIFIDTEYKDTPEGRLFFNIQSAIAEYELALIKKRTSRGVIEAVKNNRVMPMRVPPYGYDLVDSQLIINKEESPFVKRIFQWYVYEKLTMREIGEKLYQLGAMPKRGESNNWSSSSIANILKSEVYIGKYYYNRRKTKKIRGEKTATGNAKRTYEYRDKENWLMVEIPQIIDAATFTFAQQQRATNKKHSGNIKHEYLLRKLLRCGHCGNKLASYTSTTSQILKTTGEKKKWEHRRYRCTNKNPRKYGEGVKKCPSHLIKAEHLDNYVWNEIVLKNILNPDKFTDTLKNMQGQDMDDSVTETYNILKNQIVAKEAEKKRVKNLYKKGFIDEDEMTKDFGKINNDIINIQSEMEKYEKQVLSKKELQLTIEKARAISENIRKTIVERKEPISFESKREIVELFINEIIVKSIDKDTVSLDIIGLIPNEKIRKLSTQYQVDMNTTNKVFMTFEMELSRYKKVF